MGKVSVGTGLVSVNDFQRAEPDSGRLLSSHPELLKRLWWCHVHFFIVLRFPLWLLLPLLCCTQSLSRCSLEGAVLGTWWGLR